MPFELAPKITDVLFAIADLVAGSKFTVIAPPDAVAVAVTRCNVLEPSAPICR